MAQVEQLLRRGNGDISEIVVIFGQPGLKVSHDTKLFDFGRLAEAGDALKAVNGNDVAQRDNQPVGQVKSQHDSGQRSAVLALDHAKIEAAKVDVFFDLSDLVGCGWVDALDEYAGARLPGPDQRLFPNKRGNGFDVMRLFNGA